MAEAWHILDRFTIHFFASTSLVLLATFALAWLDRRPPSAQLSLFVPSTVPSRLTLAAALVWALSMLREGWDVAHGQTLLKAGADHLSWLLGVGVSAWGLYRFWRSE